MRRLAHVPVKTVILMALTYTLVLGLGLTSAQAAGTSAKSSSRTGHPKLANNSNCIKVIYQGSVVQPGGVLTVDGINTPIRIGVDWSCESPGLVNVSADFASGVNIPSTETYACYANCSSGVVNGGFGFNYGSYNGGPSWYTLQVTTDNPSNTNDYNVRVLCSSVADCSVSSNNTCIDGSCTGHDAMTTYCYVDSQVINRTEVTSSFYANLMYSLSCDAYWTVGTSTTLQAMTISISRQNGQTYSVSAPYATYQLETPMVGGGYEQSCGSVSGASNCTAYTFASPTSLSHEVHCEQHSSCDGLDPSYQECDAPYEYNSTKVTSNVKAVLNEVGYCSGWITIGEAASPSPMAISVQGQGGPYYDVSSGYSVYSLVTPIVGTQYSAYQSCGAVGSSHNCTAYTA